METLKTFDAYAKPLEDFRIKTHTGALLSLGSLVCIVLLVVSEYWDYRTVQVRPELQVDQSRRERLPIHLNITFHKIPCHLLSIDVMDVSGEQQNGIQKSVFKVRQDAWGNVIREAPADVNHKMEAGNSSNQVATTDSCGDCYGAPAPASGCCNTCESVREAYANVGWAIRDYKGITQCASEGWSEELDFNKGEQCTIYGSFSVNKVAGNFHFAPGRSFEHSQMHVHDVQAFAGHLSEFDFSHTVNHLSFGERYEEVVNPLDGYHKDTSGTGHLFFQYFIKVVPTTVRFLNGTLLATNQFSVTQYEKGQGQGVQAIMPGIFFNYDISPMMVVYSEYRKPLSSFLTGVCAVVGGIFTVAGLVDTFLYSAERVLRKKAQLGKTN